MEALSLSLWSRWLIKRKGENIFWNSGLVSWVWWFLLLFLVSASSLRPLYLLMCLYLIGSKITLNNGSIRDIYIFCQRIWYQVPYQNKRKKTMKADVRKKFKNSGEVMPCKMYSNDRELIKQIRMVYLHYPFEVLVLNRLFSLS